MRAAPHRAFGYLRARPGVLAILVLALTCGTVMQSIGWAQTAHYALVKAIGDGTPEIDRYHWETKDKAYTDGHFYTVKAPGLAFTTYPAFAALRALGGEEASTQAARNARREGANRWHPKPIPLRNYGSNLNRAQEVRETVANEAGMIWALTWLGVIIPSAVLLLLVRSLADRLVPGYGTPAALTLGLGTLILPFTTVYFSHVISAMLGFAAFAVLWHERQGGERLGLVAGAGVLAGLGVVFEYPLALVGAIVGVFAISRAFTASRREAAVGIVRRGMTYSAGAVLAALPVAAYNVWAFGTPVHSSYANAVRVQGRTGHRELGLNGDGLFGITLPDPKAALDLMFAARGIVTITPVVLMGVVGIVFLHRRGHRAVAWTIAAMTVAHLLYNAGYWLPFGGGSPGPRFLIPLMPFLALGIAAAWKRLPAVTLALTIPSVVFMVLATITHPLIGDRDTGLWATRVTQGNFEHTILTAMGLGNGWLAITPYIAGIAATIVFAALGTGRLALGDLRPAVAVTVAWACFSALGPELMGEKVTAVNGSMGALSTILVAAALSLLTLFGLREIDRGRLAGLTRTVRPPRPQGRPKPAVQRSG
ncbi:MAG: hypothetical protein ACR2NA_08305 [Solirubrobacterales bacterium]